VTPNSLLPYNLSENHYLSEDELSTSQMKESQIILHLLFPPNEEPARAIEPGMAPFHHPSSRPIARNALFLALLFPSTTDVWLVLSCQQFSIHRSGIVGGIQAQMLWLLNCGLWSADHQTVKVGDSAVSHHDDWLHPPPGPEESPPHPSTGSV
jgi:hypothetical protein